MKYSFKLYFLLVGIALVTLVAGQAIVYFETRDLLFKSLRSKVLSIAATSSIFIDASLVEQIQTPQDRHTPAFSALQKQLRDLRRANRRPDLFLKYLYIIRPSPTHPGMVETVADASLPPESVSHVGQLHADAELQGILEHLDAPYAPPAFIHDQYGTSLTGFVPIYDSKGNYVATLGAEINAIDVIRQLNDLILYGFTALGVSLAIALIGAFFLSRKETESLAALCDCVEEIGKGNLDAKAELNTGDEFDHLSRAIEHMAKGLRERERIKVNFAHYVSEHIMEKILKSDTLPVLEGEKRKITVLFSDIRQFTSLAEKLPPEEVVALLNEYFDKMLQPIFTNSGTLDKFLGDGLMVEFGAPLDDPFQERHAVMAALQMQQALRSLDKGWESRGREPIQMGIGIHTGIAVVGYIGTQERIEYTAVGDTVVVAASLEKATKSFKTPILVSETTHQAIKDEFPFQNLGSLPIHDRTQPITVYAILTINSDA